MGEEQRWFAADKEVGVPRAGHFIASKFCLCVDGYEGGSIARHTGHQFLRSPEKALEGQGFSTIGENEGKPGNKDAESGGSGAGTREFSDCVVFSKDKSQGQQPCRWGGRVHSPLS